MPQSLVNGALRGSGSREANRGILLNFFIFVLALEVDMPTDHLMMSGDRHSAIPGA